MYIVFHVITGKLEAHGITKGSQVKAVVSKRPKSKSNSVLLKKSSRETTIVTLQCVDDMALFDGNPIPLSATPEMLTKGSDHSYRCDSKFNLHVCGHEQFPGKGALAFVRLFVAAAATAYQEPYFWRTECMI